MASPQQFVDLTTSDETPHPVKLQLEVIFNIAKHAIQSSPTIRLRSEPWVPSRFSVVKNLRQVSRDFRSATAMAVRSRIQQIEREVKVDIPNRVSTLWDRIFQKHDLLWAGAKVQLARSGMGMLSQRDQDKLMLDMIVRVRREWEFQGTFRTIPCHSRAAQVIMSVSRDEEEIGQLLSSPRDLAWERGLWKEIQHGPVPRTSQLPFPRTTLNEKYELVEATHLLVHL